MRIFALFAFALVSALASPARAREGKRPDRQAGSAARAAVRPANGMTNAGIGPAMDVRLRELPLRGGRRQIVRARPGPARRTVRGGANWEGLGHVRQIAVRGRRPCITSREDGLSSWTSARPERPVLASLTTRSKWPRHRYLRPGGGGGQPLRRCGAGRYSPTEAPAPPGTVPRGRGQSWFQGRLSLRGVWATDEIAVVDGP